jgi:hypothetical protein
MKLGVVISTNDAETVWNAFRLANFSRGKGESSSFPNWQRRGIRKDK